MAHLSGNWQWKDNLDYSSAIDLVRIAGYSGPPVNHTIHNVEDISFDVAVYSLHKTTPWSPEDVEAEDSEDAEGPRARMINLPNESFEGLFES